MRTTHSYDILIVGGGTVGVALANMLAPTGLSIALLEKQPPSRPWSASVFHPRVSAINLSSQRALQALEVWQALETKRVSPFTAITVWDEGCSVELAFSGSEIAEPVLGHIIENDLIRTVLEEKLNFYKNIQSLYDVTLTHMIERPDSVECITQEGQIFQGKIAIAADGAFSWLRQQAGIAITRKDYHQTAIVANVQTELPHQQIARQVFLNTGPLAFLPLANPYTTSIVWSLPTETAQHALGLSTEAFQTALAQAFSYRLGHIVQVEQRYSFPLFKQQAEKYIQGNILLVGDSAHVLHPLAGQGLNLGLLDAASLSDVITTVLAHHKDLCGANLRHYERWRKADNFALLQGIDLIKLFFSTQKKPISHLRSYGLKMVDRSQWIKNIIIHHAVGNRADLPSLAR